jgi:hypothetical protein
MTTITRPRPAAWAPPLACLGLAAVLVAVSRLPLTGTDARVVPVAVMLDFTVTVPFAWWWLAVRGGGASKRSLAVVTAISLLVAKLTIGDRTPVTRAWLGVVGVAIELALFVRIVMAVRAARAAADADLADRADAAAADLFGTGAVARAVGGELAIVLHALAGPWFRPTEDRARFTHHRNASRGTLVAGISMAIAIEMTGLHLLLVRAHPQLAWVLTVSSIWALLWLFGDYQALRLRRSRVVHGMVHLRVGLRAGVDIPAARVTAMRSGKIGPVPDGALRAVPKPAEPNVLLTLAEPTRVRGFYGIERVVTQIALAVDEPERFVAALAAEGAATGAR